MIGHTALTKPSDSRVGKVNNFSGRQPLLFALSTLVAWMVLASTGVILSANLTRNPFTDPLPQSAGAIIATLALITVMGWLGWIQGSGIGRLGEWWAWVLTLLLLFILIPTYAYAFFSSITWEWATPDVSSLIRTILSRQVLVAVSEEILFGVSCSFRSCGFGDHQKGILKSVLISALVFSGLHLLYLPVDPDRTAIFLNVIHSVVFGMMLGSLALLIGTIWPGVLIHFGTNTIVFVIAMGSSISRSTVQAYGYVILVEFLLAIILSVILYKRGLHQDFKQNQFGIAVRKESQAEQITSLGFPHPRHPNPGINEQSELMMVHPYQEIMSNDS